MDAWQVQDAKARFSELLDTTLNKEPQVVTRRGNERDFRQLDVKIINPFKFS